MSYNAHELGTLIHFINERGAIRIKKDIAGLPAKDWTKDVILQAYRFCNVHREHDRVTMWIAKHWREPNVGDTMLWHAMLMARMLNWPPTLAEVLYPKHWDPHGILKVLKARKARGDKVFTSAYIVSTNGIAMDKAEYVIERLNDARVSSVRVKPGMLLRDLHNQLTSLNAVGQFMSAQVIADLKNTAQLKTSPDWWDWCAPGPGSMRGLNRVMGLPLKAKWGQQHFIDQLKDVRGLIVGTIPNKLCLQDLQNCLCETDKYLRIEGGGKVRSYYKHHDY